MSRQQVSHSWLFNDTMSPRAFFQHTSLQNKLGSESESYAAAMAGVDL